ncbi:hypothetical protein GCM10027289_28710 [Tsukamurella serpentis]
MADTWTTRDLPVLRAVVELYETGAGSQPFRIAEATGFDEATVSRALRALYREPYFEEPARDHGGEILFVGAPTGDALRVAGQWPTPENQLDRLIAAFEAVAADDTQPEEERSRARQLGLSLKGALYSVAIGALGGAGGNMLAP